MTEVNATALKFGYPGSLLRRYDRWLVLLRPAQVTLGSLVLVCTDEADRFSAISRGAFAELEIVTHEIETSLAAFRPFDKINYLMLMMVDPDVHFHVIPRYARTQDFDGLSWPDAGWPGPPALATAVTPDGDRRACLAAAMIAGWRT